MASFSSVNRRPSSGNLFLLAAASAVLVFAAYSNHFRNSFHFDDGSVIQNNAYLRSLRNVPLFFRDATTFTSYTPNAAYRPLTSASFALDYWWGGGLDPLPFHVTQFGWHLVMSLLVFLFFERVLALAGVERQAARAAALGAAALFAVHRLNSETVNFLTLRSEILAAVGVMGRSSSTRGPPGFGAAFSGSSPRFWVSSPSSRRSSSPRSSPSISWRFPRSAP